MIMVKESRPNGDHIISPYIIEVQALELEKIKPSEVPVSKTNLTSNRGNASEVFTFGAKLLKVAKK